MATTTNKSDETPAITEDSLQPSETTAEKKEQATTEPISSEKEEQDVTDPEPVKFEDWDLNPGLMKALKEMGYDRPMPVQEAVFSTLSEGKDLMVQSRTGSGKTAAFGIPIAQRLSDGKKGVQSLILAPTRELAMQVAKEIEKLTQFMDVTVVPVYGGAPIGPQIKKLEDGAQIVAGTPGRVLDHIRRKTLITDGISMLALDECDEMLSMGFQEEIENIIQTLPDRSSRQTLLFSATIPKEIEKIGRRHMREPKMISLSSDSIGADKIDHFYYVVSGMARNRDLLKLMKAESPESAIIFCNTREETNSVAKYLRKNGYDAEALSSDLSQSDRERVMGRMRAKNLNFLVATDIAARGIDISELSHVINFTFPNSPEIYVHRSGRTGRAGKEGVALSLVGPREIGAFYYLKLIYKIVPKERDLPTTEEINTIEEGEQYKTLVTKIEGKPKSEFLNLARRLWQSNEGERVVAMLVQQFVRNKNTLGKPNTALATKNIPKSTDEMLLKTEEEQESPPRRRRRGQESMDSPTASTNTVQDELHNPKESRSTPSQEEEQREQDPKQRKRRRRRRGYPSDEAAVTSSETVVNAETIANSETIANAETAASTNIEANSNTDASPSKPVLAKEKNDDPSITDEDNGNEEAEEARPRRRRRRRERNSERSAIPTATSTTRPNDEELSDDEEALKARSAKRRSLKPQVTPGQHGEFWETWAADTKEPSLQVKKSEDNDIEKKKVRETDKKEDQNPEKKEFSVRLFVNVGKREELDETEIRKFLEEALEESTEEELGKITLRNTHCYVRVPESIADSLIQSCTGRVLKDRDVVVERARR